MFIMESGEHEPEKEPLRFDINPEDVPPEIAQILCCVKEHAENLLYHWKNFPIILPPSITDSTEGSTDAAYNVVTFKDLFIAPTFDELDEVAVDQKGQRKQLTTKQLEQVRENGEFEVDSIHFPGMSHRWRLTQLLQKGYRRSEKALLHDAALALRILIITARNRFHSHFFSLSQSIRSIGKGLWQLLDIVIGMPYTTPGDLVTKVREEHKRFLIAELDIQPTCSQECSHFCEFVKEKCRWLKAEKNKSADLRPPCLPYKYKTPKGTEIDLRLFNKGLMSRCSQVVKDVLDKESRGWYLQFRDRLVEQLREKNMSHEEISKEVTEAIITEYTRKVFTAILMNQELESMQPGIGKLLVDQAKSVIVMNKAVENVRAKLIKHKEELRKHLVKSYPVKSRIKAWMNEQLAAFEAEFVSQHQWTAHEEALQKCREEGLDQTVYFLQRDLTFMKDREPVLTKELSKVKIASRVFRFKTRIWMPRNWAVYRHQYGDVNQIQTVIVQTPPVSKSEHRARERPFYSVDKFISRKSSTRYPFWRWLNYIQRTWSWTWNAMFWLLVVIPWCSPVGLRALVFWKTFMPNLELSQVNGTLCPKASSLTHTLISRLRALWRNIRKARAKFESSPDTGFLGKSYTRHLNRFWNYVLKGAIGSTALVLIFPPLCVFASLFSILAGVLTPLWMPLVTLSAHLATFLFYDFDHPDGENRVMYLCEAVIFRLLIQGFFQPLAALITATFLCPFASFFIICVGLLRRGGRAFWDAFMFHAVIKSRARVPASDGFVARRVAGPGLASNYFFQIKPEQALAAVEARMELHEIQAWKDSVAKIIDQPLHEYKNFVNQCFKPFSGSLSTTEGVYKNLREETNGLHSQLDKNVAERIQKLSTGLNENLRSRIKLPSRELKLTVIETAKMLESFYPDHVLKRKYATEEEFWEEKGLDAHNWTGLANLMLAEIFSQGFLMPLEETDTCFRLEVDHLNMSRYAEMFKTAEFRDDLDVVSPIHTPKGEIDVDAPYLDLHVFNPVKRQVDYAEYLVARWKKRKWPWKKPLLNLYELEKMEIPPPLPHPANIAVVIYNRENDVDQIDLEDVYCKRVLKSAQEAAHLHTHDVASTELFEGEPSTPDHTTNSDPEVMVSHLAESERAFSEDNVHTPSPDSIITVEMGNSDSFMGRVITMIDSVEEEEELSPEGATSVAVLETSPDGDVSMVEIKLNDEHGEEGAVVYQETEANTSCMLEMEDAEDSESQDTQSEESDDKLTG